jgi:hypothetical protein
VEEFKVFVGVSDTTWKGQYVYFGKDEVEVIVYRKDTEVVMVGESNKDTIGAFL